MVRARGQISLNEAAIEAKEFLSQVCSPRHRNRPEFK